MNVIAIIQDLDVVERVLTHLELLPADGGRAPRGAGAGPPEARLGKAKELVYEAFCDDLLLWDLGDGCSPWEGVHAGYAYLPHLVSALLSRAIGEPLRLLGVSAALHFWLSGALVLLLSPAWIRGTERIAWAALAVVQPAPFLLGLNGHSFLT